MRKTQVSGETAARSKRAAWRQTAAIVPASPKIDPALLKTKAWNVRMAFFTPDKNQADPDYEMNAVFHENGIISDMLIDYNDFSVTQKLAALEKLPPDECKGGKQAVPGKK